MPIKNFIFSSLILFLFILPIKAQEVHNIYNKEAEELFKITHPLGISIGIQTMSYSQSGNAGLFNHEFDPMWIPEFGFKYNFLQKNRFNFNAGIFARLIQHEYYYYAYSHETDVYNMSKDPQDDITYHIPLTAEYIFHTSKSTSFVAHAGYELQYYRFAHPWWYVSVLDDPYSNGKVELHENFFKKKFSHGVNLGVGVYQKLGSRLIKFELNYHLHFEKLLENKLIAIDLPNDPDVNHSVDWNGNHISAKLIFYPFKRLED